MDLLPGGGIDNPYGGTGGGGSTPPAGGTGGGTNNSEPGGGPIDNPIGGGGGGGTNSGGDISINPSIGDSPAGGGVAPPGGNTNVNPHVDGNLGSTQISLNTYLLKRESFRRLKEENLGVSFNHRYKGHREAFKFNFAIQNLLAICVPLAQTLYLKDQNLKTAEFLLYPTSEELAIFNHVREQTKFKEWLLLKDVDRRWYFK